MSNLLGIAITLHQQGYAPLPIRTDGSKAPAVKWTDHIDTPPTEQHVIDYFTRDSDGIGVVCGAASGNLEMLELEGRALHLVDQLAQLMTDHDAADLWHTITTGWAEQSPSGGIHWHYRISDGPARGNTKLARTADREVLIETRGQGGFTVIAPSAGRTHPTGKPWTITAGGPATCPTITSEQRDLLHAVTNLLDQTPEPARPTLSPAKGRAPSDGLRPGDDYNQRITWNDILGPEGWEPVQRFAGNAIGWRRPGKNIGISATTGRNDADNLYVFSSSTEFDTETPYSKFAAYTLLHHAGDYTAAAKTLAAQGYGSEPHRPVAGDDIAGIIAPATVGNLATVTPLPQRDQAKPELSLIVRSLERSDDGNALALIDTYGDRIRYCPERGRWLAWDGTRWHWQAANGGDVREYAKRIARALPEGDAGALTHKRRSLGAIGTTAMLTQAATDERISVNVDQLDAHPWELNTPAGIVNLRTGELTSADATKMHTRITACAPDTSADPAYWHEFLADTFGDNTDIISYLQRLVGYSSVGLVGAHVLPFCTGSGGNGKGVFLEAVQKVLGDYATTAPAGFLMARAHASHETEIARLAGARMVLCSEVNEDDHFDEAKVKQLTGGDTLTARFMRADHFTFTPTHQLWLMGNSQPAVKSGGRAFWRRLRLIPFEREVDPTKEVDDLQGILASQHGGAVLAWVIAGAADYAAHGLQEPATVKVATAEYAHDQDTVGRFLDEACIVGGGDHVQLKIGIVRTAYERWCTEAGEQPVTAKALTLALRRKGVDTARTNSARFYTGIAILADENLSPAAGNQSPDDREGGWYR